MMTMFSAPMAAASSIMRLLSSIAACEFFPPRRREQAAAAIAGDAQAAALEDARCLRDAGLLHHVAPRRDAGKAVARGGGDRFRQLPLLAHRREVEGEVEPRCFRHRRRLRG